MKKFIGIAVIFLIIMFSTVAFAGNWYQFTVHDEFSDGVWCCEIYAQNFDNAKCALDLIIESAPVTSGLIESCISPRCKGTIIQVYASEWGCE